MRFSLATILLLIFTAGAAYGQNDVSLTLSGTANRVQVAQAVAVTQRPNMLTINQIGGERNWVNVDTQHSRSEDDVGTTTIPPAEAKGTVGNSRNRWGCQQESSRSHAGITVQTEADISEICLHLLIGNGDQYGRRQSIVRQSIVQVGAASPLLLQTGRGNNVAYVFQLGDGNIGAIDQIGDANWAMLVQRGPNNRAEISQEGTANTAVVTQDPL